MKTLIWMVFLIMISSGAFAEESLFVPPDGKVFLFIGQDNETIEKYIEEVGVEPFGFMLYTSIHDIQGLFEPSPDYGGGVAYADDLMRKYPKANLQLGLYMVDALKDVYQGRYDRNIDRLAAWFKNKHVTIYLRIGYEFDGPHNHYDPDDYIKAYQYLVDRLRKAGVNNVAYVWHSYAFKRQEPLMSWYPGDDYVDWVGISCFSLPNMFIEPVIQFARVHKKPVMIAEGTPQGTGVHKGRLSWESWYKIMLSMVETYKIKAISYINSNWEEQRMWAGQGWGDARIQANDSVKEFWLQEIQKDKYMLMPE